MSAACASFGSCSGWRRALIFARAYGTTAFTAPSTGSDVDARDGQRRARPDALAEAARADERDGRARPLRGRGTRRRCTTRRSTPRGADRGRRRPRCSSWSVASAWMRARRASGAAPPNCPLCFGPASVVASTMTAPCRGGRSSASARRGGRFPCHRSPSRRMRTAPDPRAGSGEGAADLLLPLDHDLDPDRRLAVPGAERTDVHQDVRLRVGRASSEDRAVALGRLERRRLPLRLVADRARRRSGVEQHRGRTRRRRDLADDDRRGVGQLERADLLDARVTEAARRPRRVPRAAPAASAPGSPATEIDGIATSRARSRFSCGISAATLVARSRESVGLGTAAPGDGGRPVALARSSTGMKSRYCPSTDRPVNRPRSSLDPPLGERARSATCHPSTWQGDAVSRPASSPARGLGAPRTSGPVRVFAGSRGQPRFRRATDLLLLLPSLLALALLVAAYPPSRLERSFDLFLRSFPDWLAPLWGFFHDGLAVWAAALLVAAAVLRRPAVLLDALGAVAVAATVTVVAARLATGEWPDVGALARLRADISTFPVVRTAAVAAVVLVVGPHLVQPLQRFGRYLLLLGIAGALLSESAPPSAQLAAFVVALVAASVVRLALGTSAGYPRSGDVLAAVRELGVRAERLEPAARQPAGVFVARGGDDDGRPLLVKVYGRDAYDTQLAREGSGERSCTRATAHEPALSRLAGGRARGARHACSRARPACRPARSWSPPSRRPETPCSCFRDDSRPLERLVPEAATTHCSAKPGQALAALGPGGHRPPSRSIPRPSSSSAARSGLVELRPGDDRGAAGPAPHRPGAAARHDRRARRRPSGPSPQRWPRSATDDVVALLPYLQAAAFGPTLRRALGAADDRRRRSPCRQPEAPSASRRPSLVKLRRVTWWSARPARPARARGVGDHRRAQRPRLRRPRARPRRRLVGVDRGRLRRRAAAARHAGDLDARVGPGPPPVPCRSTRCSSRPAT